MPTTMTPYDRPVATDLALPEVEDATRREFIAGAAAAAPVAACGADGDPDMGLPVATVPNDAPTTSARAGEGTPRVVDLADNVFDLAVLGVPPVANIYGSDFLEPVLGYLELPAGVRAGVLDGSLAISGGTADIKINLEAVAALRPELILVTEQFVVLLGEQTMSELRAIGEVVVIPDGPSWQERSRAVAAAVGLDGRGNDRINEAQASIDELADTVRERGLRGREVSLLRTFTEQFLAFVPPSLASTIVAQVGLTQPAAQLTEHPADSLYPAPGYAAQVFFSLERLGDHDADLIVVIANSPTEAERILDDPLLAAGRAVSAGAVHVAPYFLWALNSAIGVQQICADLTAALGNLA